MAACGVDFTVAVTEDGELLACGQGDNGQLGLGAVLHQQQPARAGGPEFFANQRIRLAAAGSYHLAVVAEDGAVYTCGDGRLGRLGLGDGETFRNERNSMIGKRVSKYFPGHGAFKGTVQEYAIKTDNYLLVYDDGDQETIKYRDLLQYLPRRRLTRVPQAEFGGSRVVMVSCGGSHTMAMTAAGHVWTCGGNLNGQLGVGDTANRLGFTQVDAGHLGARGS